MPRHALGPWRAYDVRILEPGPGGALQFGARWRIGHVRALTSLRAADGGTLLAIAKDNAASSKLAFSPSKPNGEPAGLYVVRRRGEALVPVHHAPFPVPEGSPFDCGHVRWLGAGDLDGDGLDDLVVRYEVQPGHFASALILRQLPDGSFAAARLGHVIPFVLGNFDDDPAAELLVQLVDGDAFRFAVLGAGGEPLTAAATPRFTAAPSPLADPVLARDGQPPQRRSPDPDRRRPERERDEDVGPAADPAVEQHRHAPRDRLDDRRQRVDADDRSVEQTPAVVADDDPRRPVIDRHARVIRVQHSFHETPASTENGFQPQTETAPTVRYHYRRRRYSSSGQTEAE